MADIAIYTACYGSYDLLRPQAAQDIDMDWLCFTDNPELEVHELWRKVVDPPRFDHPRMAAKWHKCFPPFGYKATIWVDANMEVTSPAFAREALACLNDGIATWRHPQRNCIYAETVASLRLAPAKYQDTRIREQARHYRKEGHPHHGGLYACGTIARDNSPHLEKLGAEWLAECARWSYQDQVSFPVVCRRLGVEPGVFPFPQVTDRSLSNPWLRIHPHLSDQ